MSFSQRKGLTPVRTMLQVGSMDDALRASLWNLLHIHIWDTDRFLWSSSGETGVIGKFAKALWFQHFKKPFSDIPAMPGLILDKIERYYFASQWNEVYDFLEVVVAVWPDPGLQKVINHVLERELAGYQLVNRQFVDVTDPQEIAALEEAISQDQFGSVSAHLSRALELLADRKNPDYRNSIKESISAVESLARILTKNEKATLGDALKLLERSKALHPALREGFSKLYGYTSDAQGIRHAMLDEPNLTAADAKFFLLSCTTFINYLKAQVGK
jgi:hypothetical protein